MNFIRAFKVALVIGVVGSVAWLFREDHLCRAEIDRQFASAVLVEHHFASNNYRIVPGSWREAWHPGMPYPVAVTCWTDLGGVSNFEKH